MRIILHPDRPSMGTAAAAEAALVLQAAVAARGHATLVVATGSSQFEVLESLTRHTEVPWEKIEVFHLDEYVGISREHPASFRRFLLDRFINRLAQSPLCFHEIDAQQSFEIEAARLKAVLPKGNFDLSMIGIGENAHVAFNDPPADFNTTAAYLLVSLDEACRRQQAQEGWFASLESVPTRAISMSVQRILASTHIICSVPDERKSEAVRASLEGPVLPQVPASILRTHSNASLYLDAAAASKLNPKTIAAGRIA